MTMTIISGEATTICAECKHPTPNDAIANVTIHATVDGRNSKHRGQFCLMCWEQKFEHVLGVVEPATPTGSLWSQS